MFRGDVDMLLAMGFYAVVFAVCLTAAAVVLLT